MDYKSQSSFKSFDYEDDDLQDDPFVLKPGTITKNQAMINPKWSGIVHNRYLITDAHKLRDLNEDLRVQAVLKEDALDFDSSQLHPVFFSGSFEKANAPLEVKKFEMSNEELKAYARKATLIRKELISRSLKLLDGETPLENQDDQDVIDIKAKLDRKYTRIQKGLDTSKSTLKLYKKDTLRVNKYRHMYDLSVKEQIEIVYNSIVAQRLNIDIAKQFRVRSILVSCLVCKLKKNPKFFDELKKKHAEADSINIHIENATMQFLKKSLDIWKAEQIQEKVKENSGKDVKIQRVRKIIRSSFGLRYKKVQHIAFLGNSQRSLVLRQQFAKTLLDKLSEGLRIINVDETWINQVDFRRRKWRQKGETNSLSQKAVQPRITLFTAIDQYGTLFYALSHGNTDASAKQLFLSELASTLESFFPDWRNNTIVLMDNASYNICAATQNHMKWLNMPFMFTGPYSYDGAPVELLFALFKKVNINPDGLSTGKKQVQFPQISLQILPHNGVAGISKNDPHPELNDREVLAPHHTQFVQVFDVPKAVRDYFIVEQASLQCDSFIKADQLHMSLAKKLFTFIPP